MDFEEILEKEFINIINEEIFDLFDSESSKILIENVNTKFNKLIIKDNNYELFITYLKEDENLSKLKKIFELSDLLEDDLEDIDLELINKKRIENPKNRLYALLWIGAHIEYFHNDEFFEYELFDFFEKVFFKYKYLAYMDYFNYNTDKIFNVLYIDNLWLTDKSINLFKKLINKYPNRVDFKVFLSQIYIKKRELIKALNLVEILFNSLQKNSPYYLNEKRFFTGMRAEIYYLSEEFDKALIDIDYIINNIPQEDVIYYWHYYLLRIAINLKINKQKEADSDTLILINNFRLFDLLFTIDGHDFKIADEYVEEYINKLAKLHTKSFNEKTNEKSFYFRSDIGKLEIFGNDNWTYKDGINPFFVLKLNNKKSLTIKIQNITNNDIELLDNKTISTEDKTLIIEWLNSKSKLSEKNIGAVLTNYQYISIVWKLLNKENNI